jgi:predicted GNAT superfamily acetyltransferase
MREEITIRRAETIAEYRACQDAQRRAWGITEEEYVVPIATMVGAQLHGGLVLGAFLPDGSAVGVSFAFLGRIEGRLGLYSQLTGVVPGHQGRGIGLRLKQAQWRHARAEGLELLAWAFDPLQAGNARFNLGKLGARSQSYIADMYGPRTDALNPGVPTDRLIVEWSTTPRPRVAIDAADVDQLPWIVEGVAQPDCSPDLPTVATDIATGQSCVLLEIPEEIGRLRAEAPELAERWRRAVSEGFTTLFARGFAAVDFLRLRTDDASRSFYVLSREASGITPG